MDPGVAERIRYELSTNKVVLFMKGTPVFPQCGFSARVVHILNMMRVNYKSIDVLADPSLRIGLREFMNWPTLPMLFIDGEFIGDSDMVAEMMVSGELQELFTNRAVPFEEVRLEK